MLFNEFTEILKLSISPVVLISGIGLLLLSMTNRLGRVIDRIRALTDEKRKVNDEEEVWLTRQIELLYRRARMLRGSIILSSMSILLTGVIIIMLFAIQFYEIGLSALVAFNFVLCISCLILSMVLFIADISLTLLALKYQLKRG